MLIPTTHKNRPYLAIGVPGIDSRARVKALRDSLIDVMTVCLSDEGTKDAVSASTAVTLLQVVNELNKDLEDKERGE